MENTFLSIFKDSDGKKVHHNGVLHTIQYHEWIAKYPYEHVSRTVYLNPVCKTTKEYQKIKHLLGDDWSTDLTSISDDALISIMTELGLNNATVI